MASGSGGGGSGAASGAWDWRVGGCGPLSLRSPSTPPLLLAKVTIFPFFLESKLHVFVLVRDNWSTPRWRLSTSGQRTLRTAG